VVNTRVAIGSRRTLVEQEERAALAGLYTLLKDALASPQVEYLLLDLGEVRTANNWLKNSLPPCKNKSLAF